LYGLKNWFFPLSRLWAIARRAESSTQQFIEYLPMDMAPRLIGRLESALHKFEHARLKAFTTEHLWEDYFFGQEDVAEERLLIAEEMRLDHRTAYNMTRRFFMPWRKYVTTSVVLEPQTPDKVAGIYGEGGENIEALFEPPVVMPEIEQSKSIPVPGGRDYWLRFSSSSSVMQDMVYARVHEPLGVENPPTLIFGHGICVEFDHYHNQIDEISELTRLGIRVVRPEAPWHGRRVIPGRFGGEQLLSTAPTGVFDFLSAQHQEWAVLMDWCRRTSKGKVAIGGSSLGAQSAKAIAMRARHWPKHLQPDALFLITHCTHIAEAALDGALSDIWNLSSGLREHGWNKDLSRYWLQKLEPDCLPVMPPENIISVMGKADIITPWASGSQHMQQWDIPAENNFTYQRGHFTVPVGLVRDQAPLIRLRDIMH
jgi:pimeloyl-ACP methyl ester carboxylesterase